MILLLAGTLLYPDTFSSLGFHFGGFRISSTLILFIIALPPVGFYTWRQRRSIHLGMIDALLLAYLVFMTVRGLFAGLHGNDLALLVGFAGYTIMLYYGIAALAQNYTARRAVFFCLAVLGVIIAVYAILEFVVGHNILYEGITAIKVPVKAVSAGYHRSSSTIGHPVALGLFLVQVAPFLFFYFIRAVDFHRRFFWGFALIVTVSALLTTFAKGSWVTALLLIVLGIFLYVWLRPQLSKGLKKAVIGLAVISSLALIIIGATVFQDLKYNTFSNQRRLESYDLRWLMWTNSATVIENHLLTGVGMGVGANDIYRILVQKRESAPDRKMAIDNIYLSTLADEGLIGFVLLGSTFVMIGRQIWKIELVGKNWTLL